MGASHARDARSGSVMLMPDGTKYSIKQFIGAVKGDGDQSFPRFGDRKSIHTR